MIQALKSSAEIYHPSLDQCALDLFERLWPSAARQHWNSQMTKPKQARQPPILITEEDMAILETMLGRSSTRSPAVDLLEVELARAKVVKPATAARPFCGIGSWVTYEDLSSGQVRTIQIVLPADADIDQRRVSVLSHVGASLLGLVADAEFAWTAANGRPHRLKVLQVGSEPRAEND